MAKRASKAAAAVRSVLEVGRLAAEAEGWTPSTRLEPFLRPILARALNDGAREKEVIEDFVAWARSDPRLLAMLREALKEKVLEAPPGRPRRPSWYGEMILHYFDVLREEGLSAAKADERLADHFGKEPKTIRTIRGAAKKARKLRNM